MTSPLMDWVSVQMVAVATTPANQVQFDQKVVMVPPEYQPRMGQGQLNPGSLGQIQGYARAGGPTGVQFVMTPPPDMGLDDAPGGEGWADLNARAVYRNAAMALVRDFGWSPADARERLRTLYDAAVANYVARQNL